MPEVTQILSRIDAGDPAAAEELLPLVYDELRKLAAAKMAQEKPGQTLQATALVHEAYCRLVGPDAARQWDGRGHFFSAAAEAMRRILIDAARRRNSLKRGGEHTRVAVSESNEPAALSDEKLLAIDDAITKLHEDEPKAAELVKLRFFAGLPEREAAEQLGVSRATACRYWTYAKAFLACELNDAPE